MYCPECGSDNPSEAKFCSNCGSKFNTVTIPEQGESAYTEGGSNVDRYVQLCKKCGEQLPPGARFCGKCGWSLDKTGRKATVGISSPIKINKLRLNVGALISGVGAILMLISLAVPWYAIRILGESANITIGDLMDRTPPAPNWAGIGLPVILVIIFASLALLAILYSIFVGIRVNKILSLLGILSLFSILGNALYLLFWLHDQTSFLGSEGSWINIIHAGSVLVFIGAIVMIVGSIIRRSEA